MTNGKKEILENYSRFLDSTGLHLTYAALSVYRNFEDELADAEKRFLRHHLDSCLECSARLKEVTEVEETPARRTTTGFGMSSPAFRYAVAAVVTVAVGVALVYKLGGNQNAELRPPAEQLAAAGDSEKFASNVVLDNLVERTVRSGNDYRFTMPLKGDTVATPVSFRWTGPKGKNYTLAVVDNTNREVWNSNVSAPEAVLTSPMEPGRYYVKLETDRQLVCATSFFVRRR